MPQAAPSTGNLLGDALMLSEPSSASLLDLKGELHESSESREVVTLKPETPEVIQSPIDLLKTSESDKKNESQPKPRVERRAEIVDPDNYNRPQDDSLSDLPSFTMPDSIRTLKRKTAPQHETPAEAPHEPDAEDVLAQARAINSRCLDTLTRLQNTNAQNERRYVLYLSIGFIILAILTVTGVVVGMGMRNTAKYNELKFKHEVYTNTLNANAVLEAEFEKEKRGSAAAYEVYQHIAQGEFVEAVEKFNEVRGELTHPAEIALLEQKIDEIRWNLAEKAYHDGVMRFNSANYEQARDAFFKSLSHKKNTDYTPRLNYYLAMSLYQLGDFEGARRYFSEITPSDLSAEMDANTRFYRAVSAEKLGDVTEAAEQYDMFLKKFRNHRLADLATKNRAKLDTSRK